MLARHKMVYHHRIYLLEGTQSLPKDILYASVAIQTYSAVTLCGTLSHSFQATSHFPGMACPVRQKQSLPMLPLQP